MGGMMGVAALDEWPLKVLTNWNPWNLLSKVLTV